jgi:predicted nucleic-acid-binding protein
MLGLDTNVLVQYLVQDDRRQFEKARRLIDRETAKGEPGSVSLWVSLLVLLEVEWVLRSRYELSKSEILGAFSALLDAADLAFEDETSIEYALYSWKDSSGDLTLRSGNWGIAEFGVILILDADRRRRNENQEKRKAARAVVSDR